MERKRRTPRSRSRCSGTTATPSRSTRSPTRSTPTRAGCTRRASRRRSPTSINRYARDKGLLKEKEDNLIGEDVREGLIAIVSVKLPRPAVRGPDQDQARQRDHALDGRDDRERRARRPGWRSTPATPSAIVTKGEAAAKARIAARAAATSPGASRSSSRGRCRASSPTASSPTPPRCELYIVEGDSAGGSAKQARDRATQAILPIRGKILNVEKARLHKTLENLEIQALITAIGTGIGEEFDVEKARYHRVVLMADADVDGAHIRTLLLTFFFRNMRELIEAGYVYIAQPPLYLVKVGKQAALLLHRARVGRVPQETNGQSKLDAAAVQGPRRDGRRPAVGHHDEPRARARCCR